jgi:hypothetical protein
MDRTKCLQYFIHRAGIAEIRQPGTVLDKYSLIHQVVVHTLNRAP